MSDFGRPRVLRAWTDEAGFPQREVVVGSVECPLCYEEVELTAEADAWEEGPPPTITGYGPGLAEHCGLMLVEQPDGQVRAFALDEGARSCADHRCGHRQDEHADMRTPGGQPLDRGACALCECPEFADEAPCTGSTPIVVRAASGKVYRRCRCGAVVEG